MNVLKIENLSYSYNPEKKILNEINYNFEKGKLYTIMGSSGSGKTTLLNLLSGLEPVPMNSGTIYHNEIDLKQKDLDDYRAKEIGLIFQGYNLITKYSAYDNLKVALDIAGIFKSERDILTCLEDLGISNEMALRKVSNLSGGQQQRVAIARSLIKDCNIIIADEPTGNLDSENEIKLLNIFKNLVKEKNLCIIIVTHSETVTNYSDFSLKLKDGKLV